MKNFIHTTLIFLFKPTLYIRLIIFILPVLGVGLAYLQASYFDGYPYDGPFQHLYPLREMDRGRLPGIDFNFFHGTAIPYLNYGVYKLVGGGIFGALFSAKLTQFFSVYFGLMFLCSRLFSKSTSNLAFLIIFGVMATETYFIGLAPLWDVSSFSIRTLAGLLVAGVLVRPPMRKVFTLAVLAVICAVGVLLGTEHGFYSAIAAVLVILATNYFENSWLRIAYATLFFAMFSIGLLSIVYGLFGSVDSLLYIKNVVSDQVWYYGSPPVLFIHSLSDIYSNPHWSFLPKICIFSLLVGIAVFFTFKKKVISDGQFRCVLFLMLWGWMGLTSNFSIVAYHYSEPLLRSMLIAMLLIFLSYCEKNSLS